MQDDWALTKRLTLNLGLRYDVAMNLFGNATALPPFVEGNRPNDTNNWQPRLGAAYSLNDQTVLRGGFGKYYSQTVATTSWFTTFFGQIATVQVNGDGRPDFASNPFNGKPLPTYEQAIASGARVTYSSNLASPGMRLPYSWQGSFGVQRQLSGAMSLNADYLFTGLRDDYYARNVNLNYNPATGANYSFQDLTHLPYPAFGAAVENINGGWSNYNALQLVFTRRMSSRWQFSGNYTLSVAKDGPPPPTTAFPVAPDLGGEYTVSVNDQRHRAVFSGIWQLPYSFQLSGLYFYGSGQRFATTWGADLRAVGAGGAARLPPDGTIVLRNSFVGLPLHRVDLRLQRQFKLVGRARVSGLIELFNVFNHANYGGYVTAQNQANYGAPTAVANVAYYPREMQLGFRFAF